LLLVNVEGLVRALIILLIGICGVTACSKSPTRPSENTPPTQTTCVYSVSTSSFSMSGGGGSATLSVTTGSGCGWSVTNNASFVTVSPTTAQTGPGTVTFTVGENPGDTRTGTLTIAGQTVTISQAPNDQLYGAWGGTITKGGGCPATLPASVEWTGTFRRTSGATNEFLISIPAVGVINQAIPVTVNGNNLLFFVPIDTLYTFNATLAADRRSLNGTFSGGSCGGTWAGTRR
jgi:hypothetical protein